MREAEKSLLLAVRNRIRAECGYDDDQCQIEYDEQAPATAGDVYVVVMTGGWQPGPVHRTSGGVNDLVYSVDIGVVRRIGNIPRDRLRNVFYEHVAALTEAIDDIYVEIDFDYTLMNAANTLITEETASTEGFIEPLVFQGMERRPRLVSGEMFAAGQSGQRAGLMRTISFGGARRITTK